MTKIWRGLERFLVSQPKFGSAGGSLADDRLQECDTLFDGLPDLHRDPEPSISDFAHLYAASLDVCLVV